MDAEEEGATMTRLPMLIAIDPGLKGAIAVYAPWCARCPETHRIPSDRDGSRRLYDETALDIILRYDICAAHEIVTPEDRLHQTMAMVEVPRAWPGLGAVAAWSLGYGVGIVIATLRSLSIPVERASPAVWPRRVGVPAGASKARRIALARERYPSVSVRTDGEADALLLLDYLKRQIGWPADRLRSPTAEVPHE